MRLLVFGGTLFLGRHVVEAALDRGHTVTLFNRGRTNPELFPRVERLRGDRTGDLGELRGRAWDAVVDTSGYLPGVVRASAAALRDAVDHYSYVSSISVYAAPVTPGAGEDAPLATIDESLAEEFAPDRYGALKALCERAVQEELPGRALVVRSGLLVGPYDPTGRLAYWTRRLSEGGDALAPGEPSRSVQLVHARDMAEWILDAAERRTAGAYNVTGPASPLTAGSLLERIAALAPAAARLHWVPERFLLEQGVSPWTELPLWLPEASNGMLDVGIARALADGLRVRPLDDTLREVMEWSASSEVADGVLASGASTGGGMSRARERELLEAWWRESGGGHFGRPGR